MTGPKPSPADERALLAQLRTGTRRERDDAAVALLTSLEPGLRTVAAHLLGPGADVDDAVQEILFAVHRALPYFRGESALSTWAYRIAVRIVWAVRARRLPTAHPLESPDALAVSDGAPAPDIVSAARQSARRVTAALETLTAEQRIVLSLFAVEGISHREIAQVLGVPEGTVWSRLHGARKKLLAAMGDER